MNGKFGEFIAEKRKSRGLTLRGLAATLIGSGFAYAGRA